VKDYLQQRYDSREEETHDLAFASIAPKGCRMRQWRRNLFLN